MVKEPKTFSQSPFWGNPLESKAIRKMKDTYERFCNELREKGAVTLLHATNFDGAHVPLPNGNTKLGSAVKTLSLMPVIDCGNCSQCASKCYDLRHDVTNKACAELRCLTSAFLTVFPEKFWEEVHDAAKYSRLFRYNIGGDIKDTSYFQNMIRVAVNNSHCEFLAFTKMYDIVNAGIAELEGRGEHLPDNLHIIFSCWPGLHISNPHNLPTSFPIFSKKDCEAIPILKEFQEASPRYYWHCGDDCTNCGICKEGCFGLKSGQSVGFAYH